LAGAVVGTPIFGILWLTAWLLAWACNKPLGESAIMAAVVIWMMIFAVRELLLYVMRKWKESSMPNSASDLSPAGD
jgi:ABC-type transport system involved in cytochrome bd biosynthesis fused ATPase/permease subunit